MNLEQIILLLIDYSGGEFRGKTLLQKQIYFLSLFLKKDFGYKAHYYGPYSQNVDDNLIKLKSIGFLAENTLFYGISDNSGFEVKGFNYSLTENGKKVLSKYKLDNADEVKKIERILNKLKKSENFQDYFALSIAAKAFYIVREKGRISRQEIKNIATEYGWNNIRQESIDNAVNFLHDIKLVN
jgi:uncharacterized protein YwgA